MAIYHNYIPSLSLYIYPIIVTCIYIYTSPYYNQVITYNYVYIYPYPLIIKYIHSYIYIHTYIHTCIHTYIHKIAFKKDELPQLKTQKPYGHRQAIWALVLRAKVAPQAHGTREGFTTVHSIDMYIYRIYIYRIYI